MLDGAVASFEVAAVKVEVCASRARGIADEMDEPALVITRRLCRAGADVERGTAAATGSVCKRAAEGGGAEM